MGSLLLSPPAEWYNTKRAGREYYLDWPASSFKIEGNMVKEKSTNLLFAAYVAIESYLLYLVLGATIGRLRLSGAILNILSVFAAYIITDTIVKRTDDGRKKNALIITVLAVTLVLAITASVLGLYLDKLQLQAAYN
jgi:hypothetical protein